jgi:hypothetical protein
MQMNVNAKLRSIEIGHQGSGSFAINMANIPQKVRPNNSRIDKLVLAKLEASVDKACFQNKWKAAERRNQPRQEAH